MSNGELPEGEKRASHSSNCFGGTGRDTEPVSIKAGASKAVNVIRPIMLPTSLNNKRCLSQAVVFKIHVSG
jgi:hypothetical protein